MKTTQIHVNNYHFLVKIYTLFLEDYIRPQIKAGKMAARFIEMQEKAKDLN